MLIEGISPFTAFSARVSGNCIIWGEQYELYNITNLPNPTKHVEILSVSEPRLNSTDVCMHILAAGNSEMDQIHKIIATTSIFYIYLYLSTGCQEVGTCLVQI